MRIAYHGLAACLMATAVSRAAGPRPDPATVDGARALEEVRLLVELGPRDAGTPGARRAAGHIQSRLEAAGVSAAIDTFTDRGPHGDLVFHNVLGVIPGKSDGLILLGSHFDTKAGIGEGFQGANDSGSSTGLLIELARLLAEAPWQGPELLLAFFDGEECIEQYGPNDGLHGSRHLARRLVEEGRASGVRAVIVLDMVGARDLTITIPRNGTRALIREVFEAARQEGARDRFSLYPGAILDDHVPFLEAGMPAVNLIDFQYGSAPGKNDYWHTMEDSLDKLCADSLATVGRVTLRLLHRLVPP